MQGKSAKPKYTTPTLSERTIWIRVWWKLVSVCGFVFDIRFRDSAYSLSRSLDGFHLRWSEKILLLYFIPSMCQWDLFALLFTSICYTANAIPIMGKVSNRSHRKYPPKRSLYLSTAATAVTEATAEDAHCVLSVGGTSEVNIFQQHNEHLNMLWLYWIDIANLIIC